MATNTRDIAGYVGAQLIGRGGFGSVYKADDAAHGREVAIKVLQGSLGDAERRRFDRERQTMGRLGSHPNIIPVFESGYTPEGEGYIVMELATGGSLKDWLQSTGRLGWQDATRIMAAVASATQAAHDNGVLHRDIKPDNILIDQFGNPKLSDFGIAAVASNATATTSTTATLAHAAPELLQGEASTPAIDIYAIGSTLHALLTGLPPFLRSEDDNVAPMITRALTEPPPDLRPYGVPEPVVAVVERCLAKLPGDRQPTAAKLADELLAAADGIAPAPGQGFTSGPAAAETIIDAGYLATGQPPVAPSFPPPTGPPSQPFAPPAFTPQPPGYGQSNQPLGFTPGGHQPTTPQPGPYTPEGAFPNTNQQYANPVQSPSQGFSTSGPPSFSPVQKSSNDMTKWVLLVGGGIVAAIAGLVLVLAIGDRGDDTATTTPTTATPTSGTDSTTATSDAVVVAGQATVDIDCPAVVQLGDRVTCPIVTTNATSGEWNLPGFLQAPEPISTIPGAFDVFIEPTSAEAIGQTYVITATVIGSDGNEVLASHEFTVIGSVGVEVSCPATIALNTKASCEIVSVGAVQGEWSIPEFGDGVIETVPGSYTIDIEPTNPAAAGRTFTMTATVQDGSGQEATAVAEFTVVEG